jgi:hypothetical protein
MNRISVLSDERGQNKKQEQREMTPSREVPFIGARISFYNELPIQEQQHFMSLTWLDHPVRIAPEIRIAKPEQKTADLWSLWQELCKFYWGAWYR